MHCDENMAGAVISSIPKKQTLNIQDSVPKPRGRALFPCWDGSQVSHEGIKQLYEFQRIRCTTCITSPDTKETTPAGKGHACSLIMHETCCTVAVKLLRKRGFWQFGMASLERVHITGVPGTSGAAGVHEKSA